MTESRSEETRELESLIQFWKDSLAVSRPLMSPDAIYMVEQTIKRLEEIRAIEEARNESD